MAGYQNMATVFADRDATVAEPYPPADLVAVQIEAVPAVLRLMDPRRAEELHSPEGASAARREPRRVHGRTR
ncbi:hypothetical protein GCM10009789_28690 [Kribbella sancticallisti]|uniref:Uncharacterized protein n=1 Tax=Kribbella sancticallisti TaxID=460087 RepID=A0ABP4P5K2_9ACTN